MNEGLFRAVYVSAASCDLTDGELAAILDVSRRNNAARGITGALAYYDRAFVQVLEGPEAAVEALLVTIARDPRHTEVTVCDRARVDERAFGAWSMGWVRASDLERAGFDPKVPFLRNSPSEVVNAMFEAFRLSVRLT